MMMITKTMMRNMIKRHGVGGVEKRWMPSAMGINRTMATTFDGDMAKLYLRFFDQASDVWAQTADMIETACDDGEKIDRVVDVASGPGEPGCTVAKKFPNARVLVTDGADAMLGLANDRIESMDLASRVSTAVMDLNDFTPVKERPVDLVTAQFALMFTSDLPGSLNEIHGVLRPNGLLVGTVWEEFFILPLLRETMTKVLGHAPPAPPINPLSLSDSDIMDNALEKAGFTATTGHNTTGQVEIDLGHVDDADTFKCALIPVTPTLNDLQDGGKHGDDVFGTAVDAMRNAAINQGMIRDDRFVIQASTYRYFVARKNA